MRDGRRGRVDERGEGQKVASRRSLLMQWNYEKSQYSVSKEELILVSGCL